MLDPIQMLKQISDLDQFAKDHPRTSAAAKALFQEGFQLSVNVSITGVEPRGSDPTERLLRVAAIVKELESGTFPRSEWVEKVPELLVGFFVSDTPPPRYSQGNIDRAIETYADFVRTHLQMPNALQSLDNSLGYVIFSKMGDLFQLKGARMGGIERFLNDLEKTALECLQFPSSAASLHRGARRCPSDDFGWPGWSAHRVSAVPGSRSRVVTHVR
jgi:hypothetical protein